MTAPAYAGYQAPPRDPTAVMGSRIGAWVVDILIYIALGAFLGPTPLSPLAEYVKVPDGVDSIDACDELRDNDEAYGCVQIGDRVYFTDSGDSAIQFGAISAYFILNWVVLQGLTGLTIGKALFGLRTVNENGEKPGLGRALGRSVLWIIDGAPWCFPLVGLVTGLTSTGHRRVGDMAVKTFVVSKADAGRPVEVPGMGPGYGAQGYAAPGAYGAPGYGAPGYGTPTTYPTPGGYPAAPGSEQWTAPPAAPPGAPGASPWAVPSPGAGAPPAPAAPAAPAPPAAPEMPTAPPTEAAPEETITPFGSGAADSEPAPADETPATDEPAAADESTPAEEPSEEPAASAENSAPTAPEPEAEAEAEAASEPAPDAEATTAAEPEVPATEPEPAAQPESAATPAAQAQPEAAAQPAPAAEQPQAPTYNPQWDAARGTYIQWDPNRSRWLAWDDNAKQWNPI